VRVVAYHPRQQVLLAARLECMLAVGSRPSERRWVPLPCPVDCGTATLPHHYLIILLCVYYYYTHIITLPTGQGSGAHWAFALPWIYFFAEKIDWLNSALRLLVGRQEGHSAHKTWVMVCWWWWFDWSFAHLIAPVVTTTSIILSSNKIQNGDILTG